MSIDEFLRLVEIAIWPAIVLIVFFFSRKSIFSFISQYGHVEVESSVAKIILKELKAEKIVSSTQVKMLRGLTGHDLWALDAFIKQPDDSFRYVSKFSPTRKAMVFSFMKMGLLEMVASDGQRIVQPTKLADEVIDAANRLI